MDYNKPVAHYWPEFGQNGKEDILVKHLVSHQVTIFCIMKFFSVNSVH